VPPLGAYDNGVVVNVLGKQFSPERELWWLIPFAGSADGRGWVYADFTTAYSVDQVPWITAPPLPTATLTPTPTASPTVTPTPTPPVVLWRITGRVVDGGTGQPLVGALVNAWLGQGGAGQPVTTGPDGRFEITAQAPDDGNLRLTIAAEGYLQESLTAGPVSPRVYNFLAIELVPAQTPTVPWSISGRVIDTDTGQVVPEARVEAILGTDAVRIETVTDAGGQFSMHGEARDAGFLTLNVTAGGYQPQVITLNQSPSRVYTLPDIELIPLNRRCRYESVLQIPAMSALSRLQFLGFTALITQPVTTDNDQSLVGLVLNQEPEPPPPDQLVKLACDLPITLGVGVQD
jgi:hypothetical protein